MDLKKKDINIVINLFTLFTAYMSSVTVETRRKGILEITLYKGTPI